ncbi:MAG: metallophosphoesterase family protein [Myxococcota bacterium]
MVRLAHFSDVHVTASPTSEGWRAFRGKRLAGTTNYFLGNRRKHFAQVTEQLPALLASAEDADHVLCTGDLTQMSFESEFARCASLLGDRLQQSARFSFLPGNHDRYTRKSAEEQRFERWFGSLTTTDWPWLRFLDGGVALVSIDVVRPRHLLDSSGLCGEAQRARLHRVLTRRELREQFVIVALHYGLLRADGRPDSISHRVRDYRAILDILDDPSCRVDLVVHGHIHDSFVLGCSGYSIACSGSATDLHHRPGYNVYEIDPATRRFQVERRSWSETERRYLA